MAADESIAMRSFTRAGLDAAAAASQLAAGEPYLITDESRIAVGLSATAYETYSKGDGFEHPNFEWRPILGGGITTISSLGFVAPTNMGTGIVGVGVLGSALSRNTNLPRLGSTSATTAGSTCGFRYNASQPFLTSGTGSVTGGFDCVLSFMIADVNTTVGSSGRNAVGLRNQITAYGNANPSEDINFIGLASDAGDANWSIMHNDSAGTCTTVALGSNFPVMPASSNPRDRPDLILLRLRNFIGSSDVLWQVRRVRVYDQIDDVSGVITTNNPAAGTALAPVFWRNNGAVAASCRIDLNYFVARTPTTGRGLQWAI